METFLFQADAIENIVNDHHILIVGFYSEEGNHYLMIQLGLEFDEQDVELGMNTYYIERDDQSFGGYGGVEKVILGEDKIQFLLTERGKKNMDCDNVLIQFLSEGREHFELEESLRKIFGDILEIKNSERSIL